MLLAACGGSSGDPPALDAPPAGPITEDPAPPVPPPAAAPASCDAETALETQLRCLIKVAGVTPLEQPPVVADALFNAGRALFGTTDGQILSGTRTVSCATCHPTNNAGVLQSRSLTAGLSGGTLHRNASDLVNKLVGGRRAMFWDGRVELADDGSLRTPAGDQLPAGLDSLLAAQSLFPLLSRDEMLGYPDDGSDDNELADINPAASVDSDPRAVWAGIVARVRGNAVLLPLLQAAYPTVAVDELGIQHIANALAAFQTRRWNPPRAPAYFHAYLAGTGGLTDKARRGGILFFGKAGCGNCHNGPLLSDGKYHNIGVPQIGPGFGSGAAEDPPRDKGRYEVSGAEADLYAFLTPSLWEVKVTQPYMHNGVFSTLERAVRHQLDVTASARGFDCATDAPGADGPVSGTTAPAAVAPSCRDATTASALYEDLLARLDDDVRTPVALTDDEFSDLITFLEQLTNGAN